MEQAISLFGYLIITFLGIVAPILVILLSMFREGTLELTSQYESRKSQSERNIKEQLEKQSKTEKIDVKAIDQSLKELKAIKKTAGAKLSYLSPKNQILRLFIPLLISFLGVISATLTQTNIYYLGLSIAVSLVCFVYVMIVLWKLLGIMIEVRKTIDDDRKEVGAKTMELLSTLAQKESGDFLQAVHVMVEGRKVKDSTGKKLIVSANKKQELKIGIDNDEDRMAKNVEIGFTFPSSFIVEGTSYYSTFNYEEKQIVRYETSLMHGNTALILKPLIITPLKKGDYKIQTFIKAENIKSTFVDLELKVSESFSQDEIVENPFGQEKSE